MKNFVPLARSAPKAEWRVETFCLSPWGLQVTVPFNFVFPLFVVELVLVSPYSLLLLLICPGLKMENDRLVSIAFNMSRSASK